MKHDNETLDYGGNELPLGSIMGCDFQAADGNSAAYEIRYKGPQGKVCSVTKNFRHGEEPKIGDILPEHLRLKDS